MKTKQYKKSNLQNPNYTNKIFPLANFNFAQKILWIKIFIFICLPFSYSLNAKDVGICYQWSEGDAQHLDSCEASSLEKCSKGKKSIQKTDTAFQNYTGKLFLDKDSQSIFEFKLGSIENCEKEIIKAARAAELTMCDNWGKSVYSTNLKVGDKAYIYGKSVNIRESPSSKAKKLFSPDDREEVTILEKSNKEDKVEKLYSAFWFKVTVKGKTGWVYGQFIHPNPNSKNEFISSE